jgi:putative transcriptional regulator
MAKRDIAKELIQGLEEVKAWKRGERKLKTFTVKLPKAADVPVIRKELGYSQDEFASAMGVSVGTLRNWEQARREPQGPARALLLVARTNPEVVREAMQALLKPKKESKAEFEKPAARKIRQAA